MASLDTLASLKGMAKLRAAGLRMIPMPFDLKPIPVVPPRRRVKNLSDVGALKSNMQAPIAAPTTNDQPDAATVDTPSGSASPQQAPMPRINPNTLTYEVLPSGWTVQDLALDQLEKVKPLLNKAVGYGGYGRIIVCAACKVGGRRWKATKQKNGVERNSFAPLIDHLRAHARIKPYRCPCGFRTSRKHNHKQHYDKKKCSAYMDGVPYNEVFEFVEDAQPEPASDSDDEGDASDSTPARKTSEKVKSTQKKVKESPTSTKRKAASASTTEPAQKKAKTEKPAPATTATSSSSGSKTSSKRQLETDASAMPAAKKAKKVETDKKRDGEKKAKTGKKTKKDDKAKEKKKDDKKPVQKTLVDFFQGE